MTAELAGAFNSAPADLLLPAWLHEAVVFIRNVALVAIPFALYFASRSVERKRATLNLVRNIEAAPEIVERLERLYQFRKFEEGQSKGLSQTPKDPYEDARALFNFDSVIVLNYYEAACTEIEEDWVNETLLYKSTRNTIIGAKEVLLKRYSERVGEDQSRSYPNLCQVAERWRQRADPYREVAETHIPGA